jgi:hypothetical protein
MRGCWEGATVAPIGIGARTAETIAPFRPSIAWTEVDAALPGPELASPNQVATVTTTAPEPSVAGTTATAGAPITTTAPDRSGESAAGSPAASVAPGILRPDAAPPGLWGDIDP